MANHTLIIIIIIMIFTYTCICNDVASFAFRELSTNAVFVRYLDLSAEHACNKNHMTKVVSHLKS